MGMGVVVLLCMLQRLGLREFSWQSRVGITKEPEKQGWDGADRQGRQAEKGKVG